MANEVYLGPGLPTLPEDLLLARDRGDVLFVVGAGASYPAPSNLPDFAGLVANIYSIIDPAMSLAIDAVRAEGGPTWNHAPQLLTHQQRTELKFFCQKEYDVVLGMLERRIDGDASRQSTVRRAALQSLAGTIQTNHIHDALVHLGQRFGQTLLATTNFDRLLTEAAKSLRYSYDTFALGEIPNPSKSLDFNGILHIHGKLPWRREIASALILTDQDFGDFYLRRHSVTSFLYDAARIFHLVLVGYSANDSPVRYLLNAIAGDERHFIDLKARYAFVGCDPSDERTAVEWQTRGITPITYDRANNHQALADLLVRWADIIPGKRNERALKTYLKSLALLDPGSTDGAAAMSFLRYYIQRSNATEQTELAKIFSSKGSSPRWLAILHEVIRDTMKVR
ncbi:SIR2 family protein [Rhizobium leguminosarum]|uniref:SIR2 family protein n=1 Tax=Rhizobium leguminosarum TaxID=384 RepID=UPI0024A8A1DA|nr:SIR2 family protein [Rhizobium leguminosarum]MDI5923533.1 SIR2 family protein [Rhizobium leguminosarum]